MCDFRVGEEVVAIDDGGILATPGAPKLKVGNLYIIESIEPDTNTACDMCGSVAGIDVVGLSSPDWFCPCSFRRPQRRNLTEWLSTSVGNTDGLDKTRKVEKRERVE